MAAALAAFGERTRRFAQLVDSKGTVEGADGAASRGEFTTHVRQPMRQSGPRSSPRNFLKGISVSRVERRKGSWLDTPSPRPTTSKAR
jgi:hypothetical protein